MRRTRSADEPAMLDELYHCNSKHGATRLGLVGAREARRRERLVHALYEEGRGKFTTFPSAPRIPLPQEDVEPQITVGAAIRARRSQRVFGREPLSAAELGTLLRYGYGLHEHGRGSATRAVPSGGGLYPLDLYVLQGPGGTLAEGVHHYHPGAHALQQVRARCDRRELQEASIYPDIVVGAASCLAVVADMPRTRAKYGERAYRLALLEAGHVSQNLYLVATALGLGIVALDGFYDDRVHALLGVDGLAQIALILFALGRPDA